MPLPIVPMMLGADYTDAATAQEIKTGQLQSVIDDKVQQLAGDAKEGLSDLVSGVGRVLNKAMPAAIAAAATLQLHGTQGTFQSFLTPVRLESRFMMIPADNSNLIGYPSYAANTLLSSLSGFVLCENAVLAISGTMPEEEAIEDMLNAGIFIE